MNQFEVLKSKLNSLAKQVWKSKVALQYEVDWGGAGVNIRVEPRVPKDESWFSRREFITRHHLEASFMFYKLMDLFYESELVDGGNKEDFFCRLANAGALAVLETEDQLSAKEVQLAIMQEAFSIYQDFYNQEFDVQIIGPSGMVADDFVPLDERKGFTNLQSMREFYQELGFKLKK
jgi:hypothetical protein